MRRGVLARGRALSGCVCALLVVGLAGCTTGATSSSVTVTGKTLTIYASLPQQTSNPAQARDVLDAEQLALAQLRGQVTSFKLGFVPLTTGKSSDHARTAIQNTNAIAYLGEVDPGASADSIPITNDQDVLQLSATDTALEYTQSTPAIADTPNKYYAEGHSSYGYTFARVVPSASLEAKAQISEMRSLGVTRLYVADDGSEYGKAIAAALKSDASPAITVVPTQAGADGVFYGANDAAAAASFFNGVAATNPAAKLFGPSALDDNTFAAALTVVARRNVYISAPGFLPADLTQAGKTFVSDFKASYGHDPALGAIFGYETMAALLAALHQAGASASDRSTVVRDFFKTNNASVQGSVLPPYSIRSNGDTSLGAFVFSRFKTGQLVPFKFAQVQG
jgi:ABC-type branched-subunit amino acid transport system substrate-binding protein